MIERHVIRGAKHNKCFASNDKDTKPISEPTRHVLVSGDGLAIASCEKGKIVDNVEGSSCG